jgi:hypothetical protein
MSWDVFRENSKIAATYCSKASDSDGAWHFIKAWFQIKSMLSAASNDWQYRFNRFQPARR